MWETRLTLEQQRRIAELLYQAFIRLRSLPSMLHGDVQDDLTRFRTLVTYAMAYGEAFHNLPLHMFREFDFKFMKRKFKAFSTQCPDLDDYIRDLEAIESLGNDQATTEEIVVCQKFWTLKELLRPGLKAIFVGINPTPKSVKAGHYYQGRSGRRFWNRLTKFGITDDLPRGREDQAAFKQGFGFADLIREPTKSSKDFVIKDMQAAVPDLIARISATGDRPHIVLVFAKSLEAAGECFKRAGYPVLSMPARNDLKNIVAKKMKIIRNALGIRGAPGKRKSRQPSKSRGKRRPGKRPPTKPHRGR